MLSTKKLLYKILQTLAVSNSYQFTACGKPWYFYRVGRTVFFDAPTDIASASAGLTTIGTIPAQFRPMVSQRIPCANNASSNRYLQILTDGNVILYMPTATTSASNGAFSATYLSAS